MVNIDPSLETRAFINVHWSRTLSFIIWQEPGNISVSLVFN